MRRTIRPGIATTTGCNPVFSAHQGVDEAQVAPKEKTMSDQPESLLLVYLRRIDANVGTVRDEVSDIRRRVTTLEMQVGQLMAAEQSHYAATMSRLDRFDARLDRLERRADIVEA